MSQSGNGPEGIVTRAVYLTAIHSVDQTFSLIDTAQVIDFDTLVENQNIVDLGSGEFQIKDEGAYLIVATVQVTKTLNPNMNYEMWLQKDIGSGFVDVDNSTTENEITGTGLGALQSKSVTYVWELQLAHNDKIRLQNSVDNIDLSLMAFTPNVGPDVPSSKITITKTGRL